MNMKVLSLPGLFRVFFVSFVLLLLSCNNSGTVVSENSGKSTDSSEQHPKEVKGISEFDIGKPFATWNLPEELKEISGISPMKDTGFFAIEDLDPNVYLLRPTSHTSISIEKVITFADKTKDKFDIEDVTHIGDTIYALWSHGKIFKIWNWNAAKPQVVELKTGLHKENNTEGIAYDPVTGDLLVACKNDAGLEDEKKSTRAIYEFDPRTNQLKDQPFLLIHKKDFESIVGEKVDFYPSAIAVHPDTHDLYILSTRENKCLAIFTHDGKLREFTYLDRDMLPQPEGICFSHSGTLYISSQGKHGKAPVILGFAAKK
jgi:hypothetical protein